MPTRVVVLGGGVAGMSAAHELIERGFEVVVLERADIAGGKARSIPVIDDGSGSSGHQVADRGAASIAHKLPGEHGFRFFPGFYKHVIDTMSRTPSFDGREVPDHLVPTTRVSFTQYGKPPFEIPAAFPSRPTDAGALLRAVLVALGPVADLTPDDLAFFGARFWQLLTSCSQRRLDEYERTSWWDFVDAERRSDSYRKFLATGFTRSLVASQARRASARTVGSMFVQMMLTAVNPAAGTTDRVLDGPTNLVWIDPWLAHLQSRGVDYAFNTEVDEILSDQGRIVGIAVRQNGKRSVVRGHYYVAALPIERMAPLVNRSLLAADPALGGLKALSANVAWMNGVQFYLRRELSTARGHVIHIDTEWALTSISQLQFWRDLGPEQFGDSNVRGVLSVDVSDWTAPGSDGRPAMRCSREEAVYETWRQLKRSMNVDQNLLRDEDLHSWFLDPDIVSDPARPGLLRNSEPLLVNLINTWALRPEAVTAIPNLFLASDYVRTHTDLATMEGANEAARRAVNGVLDAVKFEGARCAIWPLYEPEILAPWRLHDAARLEAGLPWDDSLIEVAAHAIRDASPLLERARPLLQKVAPFVNSAVDALDRRANAGEGPGENGPADRADGPAAATGVAKVDEGPTAFLERLAWYRDMLADTLASGVPSWGPQKHLYGPVREFISRSGKGLRPALCIATARALGGRAADALPAAAGIEMLHNAFLVHDDIEDGSQSRRGAPTMHRRAGVPIAVNAGDAMNALGMRLLRRGGERLGPATALRILDEVDHMLVETLEGQATDLGWTHDNDLSVGADDYFRLVLKKTAWYSFIHPMRIGALIADGEDQDLDRFDRFGYLLGLAFQITDDILNLSGEVSRYGKEIDGDLWEGKRTLLLTYALDHAGGADRGWISNFLARPRERRLPREILRLHQIIANSGAIEWAQQAAGALSRAALREFHDRAFAGVPESSDLEWLRGCIDFLVKRQS
jgi:geranylgeranyl pyrophosphate synthase/uncharacterized protein with NAD-binding domain and iron-sulfur cluster